MLGFVCEHVLFYVHVCTSVQAWEGLKKVYVCICMQCLRVCVCMCLCVMLELTIVARLLHLLPRYHPAILKMKLVLQEYGRPVIGLSARYHSAYSTLDRVLWWNVDTSGGVW